MIKFILEKIIGTPSEREIKKLQPLVDRVNELEDGIKKLSDTQIKEKHKEFISRHKGGESLNDLMPEAFAVVREVCRRNVGMRHFDVQIIGGKVLFDGKIAEMATGEGKTLVAVLPVYLQSIAGTYVHLVTVNDYLAKRDSEWMGPAYKALGLSCGFIQSDMESSERQKAYKCNVVYITNNEIGFDYLRDNMAISPEQQCQGKLEYAIIDELDSVLIDEARTPLIISGPSGKSSDKYYKVDRMMPGLKVKFLTEEEEVKIKYEFEKSGKKGDYRDDLEKGFDAIIDEKRKNVHLTTRGTKISEDILGVKLFDDISGEWVHHINQALRSHYLFKKDVDYVIKEGQVVIVDEFTGRMMPGRRWSDGLHQAVEAKEKLRIKEENQTLATITFQNFFKLYKKLAGMTGTALTEQNEFFKIYKLPVVAIPPNKTLRRTEHPDAIYKTEKEKFNAVLDIVVELNKNGNPVLVGSRSIDVSERLSAMLSRRGIKHNVLNAKYHMKEAEIIAQSGSSGTVTISTNMAGRGTDIILGGNPKFLARQQLERENKDLDVETIEDSAEFKELYNKYKKQTDEDHEKVVSLGGLHIIGTERHESRRVDNQLRGRSGRQGDPGESKFFIAMEDELMRLFGSDRIITIMDKLGGMEEGEKIEHPLISRAISNAQKRVEAMNFDIRKNLLEYDDVMDSQRKFIYKNRNLIVKKGDIENNINLFLNGEGEEEEIESFIDNFVNYVSKPFNGEGFKNEEDRIKEIKKKLSLIKDKEFLDEIEIEESEKDKNVFKEDLKSKCMDFYNLQKKKKDRKEAKLIDKDLKNDFGNFVIESKIIDFIIDYIDILLEEYIPEKQHPEEWDTAALETELITALGINIKINKNDFLSSRKDGLRSYLEDSLKELYNKRKESLGSESFSHMERMILLQIIDLRWKDHLYDLDQVKESVSLSGYAGKDPIVEYKNESFHTFTRMMDSIKRDVITYIFRASGEALNLQITGYQGEKIKPDVQLPVSEEKKYEVSRAADGQPAPPKVKQRIVDQKTGRNAPCTCGSGKKYKYCCGR